MLLNTSGLVCLHHAAEPQHHIAVSLLDSAPVRLTHNYVLAKFVAPACARGFPRQETPAFAADLQESPEVTVIYVDRALHFVALKLLQERLDKSWSLCDAVSFTLMQRSGLTEALTTDHQFEQAGFVRLLTP